MGCHLWGLTESDTTEATQQWQQQQLMSRGCACVHMCCGDEEKPRPQLPAFHNVHGLSHTCIVKEISNIGLAKKFIWIFP